MQTKFLSCAVAAAVLLAAGAAFAQGVTPQQPAPANQPPASVLNPAPSAPMPAAANAPPSVGGSIQMMPSPAASQPIPSSAQAGANTNTNNWRFRWHNGQWWYYNANNQWLFWTGSEWLTYTPETYSQWQASQSPPSYAGSTSTIIVQPAYDPFYYGRSYSGYRGYNPYYGRGYYGRGDYDRYRRYPNDGRYYGGYGRR